MASQVGSCRREGHAHPEAGRGAEGQVHVRCGCRAGTQPGSIYSWDYGECLLTYLLTCTYLLTYPLTYLLTYLPTYALTYWLTYLLTNLECLPQTYLPYTYHLEFHVAGSCILMGGGLRSNPARGVTPVGSSAQVLALCQKTERGRKN